MTQIVRSTRVPRVLALALCLIASLSCGSVAQTISSLPAGTTPTGTEYVAAVQGSITVKLTTAQIAALGGGGGGGGGAVASVFGRTGTVVAQSGDYTFDQIGSKPTTVLGYGITDANVVGPSSAVAGNIPIFSGITGKILADSGLPTNVTIGGSLVNLGGSLSTSAILDSLGSTRGSLAYRGASGWTILTPGANGFVLASQGTGADPHYINPSSGGTVTSVDVGTGLTAGGSPITTTGTINLTTAVNAQTGTSYTVVSGDGGKIVSFSNAASIAVTLPSAATAGFVGGFGVEFDNIGVGIVTITTSTSIFDDGTTTLVLAHGQDVYVWSDGTNYHVAKALPTMAADTLLANASATAGLYPSAISIPSCANDGAHGLVYASHALACAVISGGGGGSPGGSTTQIQYNNGGVFGGVSTLAYNGSTITNSANAAASTPVAAFTGTTFSGTGTTSTPLVYINAGTAPTTWSTAGTEFGINAASGFTGSFLDFHVNGGSNLFTVSSTGLTTSIGGVIAGSTTTFSFSGRSKISSPADGVIKFSNTADNAFTRLDFGGITSSYPAIARNAAALNFVLADASGDASITAAGLSLSSGLTFTGTAPTPTGTGSPTIASGSTDSSGEVTAGASATSVVITFATAKTNAPFCVVTSQTQLAAFAYAISTTAITVTQTATSGNKIDYHCTQH